jgi:hypothetical protein
MDTSQPWTLCFGLAGGRPPDRLPVKSEPVTNRCDVVVERGLSSELDRAVRSVLAAVILFVSIDVTFCLKLSSAGFLWRDSATITVRWACK